MSCRFKERECAMYSMRRMKLSAVRVCLAQRATGDYHRAAGIDVTHLAIGLIRDRLLLHSISAAYHNLMPPAGSPSPDETERQLLYDWIATGKTCASPCP